MPSRKSLGFQGPLLFNGPLNGFARIALCIKTHVHKITNVTVLYMALTFLGPNGTLFARCQVRAQKSLDFQGPPL
jgi:hypothetical protein